MTVRYWWQGERLAPRCACGERAVASFLVREGRVPEGGHDDRRNPDRSALRVVRVCEAHRPRAAA